MSEEKKDFVVKDRRIFSQDTQDARSKDEEKPDSAAAQESREPQPRKAPQTDDSKKQPTQDAEAQESPQLPEVNFATFVVSLNASALLHLGAIEDPTTGKTARNLPMAKQTIDILKLLQEKTAGNLTKEEESLLKNILYDLRIMYVKEKG